MDPVDPKDEPELEPVPPGEARPGEDEDGVADKGNPTDPSNPTG